MLVELLRLVRCRYGARDDWLDISGRMNTCLRKAKALEWSRYGVHRRWLALVEFMTCTVRVSIADQIV